MNARDVKLLDDVVEDACDEDITDEIRFRRALRNNKSTVRIFLAVNLYISQFFVLLSFFNKLFDTGLFSSGWSEAVIQP